MFLRFYQDLVLLKKCRIFSLIWLLEEVERVEVDLKVTFRGGCDMLERELVLAVE